MATGFLSIRDPQVQDFLWRHLVPTDIRHDYTLLDAIRFVADEVTAGRQWLVGDLDAGMVFRVVQVNPWVIEPHIMGRATALRTVFNESLPIARQMGVRKIMVWTQHAALGRVVERLGFVKEGNFSRMHPVGDKLIDLEVFSLEVK
jgi:hypothetical protein